MKLLVLVVRSTFIILLALISLNEIAIEDASGADWIEVGKHPSSGNVVSLDRESIMTVTYDDGTRQYVRYWQKENYDPETEKQSSGFKLSTKYKYGTQYIQLDCSLKRFKLLGSWYYELDGGSLYLDESQSEWKYISPDSFEEMISEKVCSMWKSKEK